jgi:hypothetical protein
MDGTRVSLEEHDFIGDVETTLGSMVGEHRSRFTSVRYSGASAWLPPPSGTARLCCCLQLLTYKGKKGGRGAITVTCEECKGASGEVHIMAKGMHLDKKDLFGACVMTCVCGDMCVCDGVCV